MKKDKPKIRVFAQVAEDQMLIDQRPRTYNLVFGKIKNVAKQYGIDYEIVPSGIIFEAPDDRMQMFVQRLHFSRVRFAEM